MSRCKACDIPFTDTDFRVPGINDDGYCSYCRYVSDNPYSLEFHEYQFESITEVPIFIENYQNTIDK